MYEGTTVRATIIENESTFNSDVVQFYRTYLNAVDELKVAQVSDPDKCLESGKTDLDIHKFGKS